MTANHVTLAKMVKKFGKKLMDESERLVGNDSEIFAIEISCVMSADAVLPKITVTRQYNAPEIYVSVEDKENKL